MDFLLQFRVVLFEIGVFLNIEGILLGQRIELLLQLLILCDQGRQLNLKLNNFLTILSGEGTAVGEVFVDLVEDLLLLDFLVEHVFSLGLLILKTVHGVVSVFLVVLEAVLDLLDHLALSVDLLKLQVSLSKALALHFLIDVSVFLVHLAFLGQDVFNLRQSKVLQSLQVLYPTLSNADVDVDLVLLLVELHDDLLLSLDEVPIV